MNENQQKLLFQTQFYIHFDFFLSEKIVCVYFLLNRVMKPTIVIYTNNSINKPDLTYSIFIYVKPCRLLEQIMIYKDIS